MSERRAGLVVVLAIGFGVATIANIVWTQTTARRVARTVTAAQADRYRIDLRRRLQRGLGGPTVLDDFLDDHREDGLRYVAVDGARRRLAAGAPLGAAWPELTGRESLVALGDRYRFELNVSPRMATAFEFEPKLADGVVEDGQRGLALSLVMAVLAVLLAWAYRRALLARAELAGVVAHERHLAGLGKMSAVLAHELRNPLTSLRGHALLLEENVEATSRPKVRQILEDSARLERLITDLLDFARAGALERRDVNPAALVRDVLAARGLDSSLLSAHAAPPRWSIDERRFRQVVENLLDNALQATPEGAPPPQLDVGYQREQLELRVRDHGPGLPDGDPDELFEPFVTHRAKGTGLGLAVVRRIAEQHGGTVTADNHPGGGATFTVLVPKDGTV